MNTVIELFALIGIVAGITVLFNVLFNEFQTQATDTGINNSMCTSSINYSVYAFVTS